METIESHFGPGPVTDALLAWQRGEIGTDVARQQLLQPAVRDAVDIDEFARLSDLAVRWCYRGHWQEALAMHGWMAAMMVAAPERYGEYVVHFMLEELRIVTNALWHHPDAALYHRTVALAEPLQANAGLSPGGRSKLAHELGILHLDPWAAGRRARQEVEIWLAQAVAPVDASEPKLPDGKTALDRAEHWLRLALPDAKGVDRLETLKALLQTIFSREMFSVPVDEPAARVLLMEALALLQRFPHRDDIGGYLRLLAPRLGVEEEQAAAAQPASADEDWELRLRTVGIEVFWAAIVPALRATDDAGRREALRLARRVGPLIDSHAGEAIRTAFHQQLPTLLAPREIGSPPEVAQMQQALAALAQGRPDDPDRLARASPVIGWVLAFASQDREPEALALLSQLGRAAPDLWDDWGAALNLLGAQAHVGAAVNEFRAEHFDPALSQYHAAWSTFVALRFDELAIEMVRRQATLVPRASSQAIQVLCELLREQPGPADPASIDAWQDAVSGLVDAATRGLETQGTADAWFAAARLAKGSTFAALVAHPKPYDWHADPVAAATRQEIAEIEAELEVLDRGAINLEAGPLFEEVLVSFRSHPLANAGNAASERRDNLARTLDMHVRQRLAALNSGHRGPGAAWRFALADVAARLPDDAVLLDFLLPQHGASMGYCLGYTTTEQRLMGIRSDEAGVRGVALGGTVGRHDLTSSAFMVADMRRHVQEDPEPGQAASAQARALLESQSRRFLGHAIEWLQSLHAAGKRHLIVVPSGPLHFYPVHLLGLDGRTLADDWIVSYLPSMDLLRREPSAATRVGAAVFALGYAGHATLAPLPFAQSEGQAVAAALGTVLAPEAQATPTRVLQALGQSRIVHIACHGELDVVAPSLQCLRLATQAGGDGRLSALDVLGLDLRGLSVLGLSACETALGRFDLGDNLMGMSANALARGADCVVGTLWPCADDASQVFFVALYRALQAGQSRRDAFRAAQLQTRRQFGEYRDWAAFYLSGMW
jgi:CHAT domain-containing protein